MNNQDAIRHLFLNDVISHKTFKQLIKRSEKLQAKQEKEVRQTNVNGAVSFAVGTLLKDHTAIQHRTVWNLVGREEATRDEVLDGLRSLRDAGTLTSFKKSGNNFQVFWTRPVPDVEEAVTEGVANETI
jgi:hypothetical protein